MHSPPSDARRGVFFAPTVARPYAPPVTARLPIRPAILWGIAALTVALLFTAAIYRSIAPASDLWDYSQEARQIARGEGFTSLYTYPTHLGPEDRPPFPVRWRMPLYAARGAMVLATGAPLPLGYLLVVAQSHAALVAFVFLLGAHLSSRRAGHIAAAAALACPLFLDAYSPGMSQVPVAALSLLVWLLVLRWKGMATALLAAVVAAAAWYLRGESLIMAPLWALGAAGFWSAGRRDIRRGILFAAAYVALCVPWPIYLAQATGHASSIHGNPMLLYTPEYPGYSSARTYATPMPDIVPYVLAHPVTFAARWVKDVLGFGLDLLAGLGPIAIGLAMAGLLLRDPSGRYAPLRPTLPFAIAIAVQVAAFAALERSPRFLVPIAPLACVMIGIAAAPALDRLCGRRALGLLFALLIAERAATVAFQTREAPRRFPPLPHAMAAALNEAAAEGAWPRDRLIASDAPDWVAWHADRPAVLLPLSRDLARLDRDHPLAAIFLSPAARARNAADGDTAWVGILDRGESIPGFNGPAHLPGGARLYVRRQP